MSDIKEKHDIILSPARLQGSEYANQVHTVTTEPEHRREDVLKPIFWAHTAVKLRPYDEIKVRCDDGTYYGRLLVLSCDRLWAKVHVLEWHNLTTGDVSLSQSQAGDDSDYELKYLGPHRKWCVIRKADQEAIREAEKSRADADLWLREYVKVTTPA